MKFETTSPENKNQTCLIRCPNYERGSFLTDWIIAHIKWLCVWCLLSDRNNSTESYSDPSAEVNLLSSSNHAFAFSVVTVKTDLSAGSDCQCTRFGTSYHNDANCCYVFYPTHCCWKILISLDSSGCSRNLGIHVILNNSNNFQKFQIRF